MAAEGEVEVAAKPAKEKKPRATKGTKEKNIKASALSHPPYFQMIKEAIMALHEKTGSSPYAIAKYVEEKHKGELPPNFKKMLAIQLRSFAGKGKLVRIKASFKLSEDGKKETKLAAAPKEKKPVPAKEKKKPREAGTKRKASSNAAAAPKKKAVAAKRTSKSPAAAPKKKAVAAKRTPKSPAAKPKKAGVATRAKRGATVKPRQPKSIKSPAAKRAKKTTVA